MFDYASRNGFFRYVFVPWTRYFFPPSAFVHSGHENKLAAILFFLFAGFRRQRLSILQIMPRHSRENTVEEKRRMRSDRNKRKRLLRAEKQRKSKEIIRQKERAAYTRARELARTYYGKWKLLAEQNKTKVGLFLRKR